MKTKIATLLLTAGLLQAETSWYLGPIAYPPVCPNGVGTMGLPFCLTSPSNYGILVTDDDPAVTAFDWCVEATDPDGNPVTYSGRALKTGLNTMIQVNPKVRMIKPVTDVRVVK